MLDVVEKWHLSHWFLLTLFSSCWKFRPGGKFGQHCNSQQSRNEEQMLQQSSHCSQHHRQVSSQWVRSNKIHLLNLLFDDLDHLDELTFNWWNILFLTLLWYTKFNTPITNSSKCRIVSWSNFPSRIFSSITLILHSVAPDWKECLKGRFQQWMTNFFIFIREVDQECWKRFLLAEGLHGIINEPSLAKLQNVCNNKTFKL